MAKWLMCISRQSGLTPHTLYQLEQEYLENDIVLVRADTSEDVREDFKNDFSDASDFFRLIDQGCTNLRQRGLFQVLDLANLPER